MVDMGKYDWRMIVKKAMENRSNISGFGFIPGTEEKALDFIQKLGLHADSQKIIEGLDDIFHDGENASSGDGL